MSYGHEKAKRVLEVLIKRSKERHYRKCVLAEHTYPEPLKCLLVGQSGTGKTLMVQELVKRHNFPLITLDATQFTPSGNSDGLNPKQFKLMLDKRIDEWLKTPYYQTKEGVLNHLVIFVDEFDKLGNSFESSGKWNQHVQANFLTLIENKEELSGVSWIFAGAFSQLWGKTASNSIGFFTETKLDSKDISDEDILKCGIIPEILGRISLVVELDRFTEKDYKHILTNELLPKYSIENIDLDETVKTAMASGLGVRSLIRQLEMLQIEQEYFYGVKA